MIDNDEAVLDNLINRFHAVGSNGHKLSGDLTYKEYKILQEAVRAYHEKKLEARKSLRKSRDGGQ